MQPESRRYFRAETARLRSRRSPSRRVLSLREQSVERARARVLVAARPARNAHNSSRNEGYSRNLCRAKGASRLVACLRPATRPCSIVVSSSVFPVKRHHVSNSGPILSSSPNTATRSPGRLRRSTAINSGNRPEANVFRWICKSTSALIDWTFNKNEFHSALIQFCEPVTLTATSVIKIRTVFPSAVPWCSVEIRRGPAFL
jgi:hypothetical protein